MELIDLSNCVTDETTELKRASLKDFISKNDNYDVKKISIALNVPVLTVRDWIVELKPFEFSDEIKIDERVRLFKQKNKSFSQRNIAKHFNISLGSVNKYLKKL